MNNRYNIAIIGQTGVGKSALINYLYGDNVVKSGIGKPVTTNGFHSIEHEINGLPITLFDSWGLEVGKHEEWLRELDEELKGRGVDKPATEWFHSVFYCIQAGGHRIQDCDVDILKKFISQNYNISVILTKCDQASEEDESALRSEIDKQIPGISIISVCSEGKKTRAGESKPFGKVDVQRKAFDDFFAALITRLPLRCESVMIEMKNTWLRKANSCVINLGIIGQNENSVRKEIYADAKNFQAELQIRLNQEIKDAFEMYGNFSNKLNYLTLGLSTGDDPVNFIKSGEDFKWFRYTRILGLSSPVSLLFDLLTRKSSAQINILDDISSYVLDVDRRIKEITLGVKERLEGVRNEMRGMN